MAAAQTVFNEGFDDDFLAGQNIPDGLDASRSSAFGVIEGPVTNPANGHVYYLLATSSWTDAEAEAVSLGGHLATINDQAEQDWVYDTFTAGGTIVRGLWIGLSDASFEGAFTWSSGEPVAFTFWHPLMPDNCNNEDYVHLLAPPDGRWNDLKNTIEGVCGGAFPWPYGVIELVNPPLAVPTGSQLACKKNRYICFQTNNPGVDVAFEIKRTGVPALTGYAGPPDANGVSGVYPGPPIAVNFRNNWPAILCVGDCEILPVQNFEVRTIPGPAPGGAPTAALVLMTIDQPQPGTPKWHGDVTGGFNTADSCSITTTTPCNQNPGIMGGQCPGVETCTHVTYPNLYNCPNGVVNANDFQMVLLKFAAVPPLSLASHFTMGNVLGGGGSLDPCLNTVVNIADVFVVIKGFQGERYPFYVCSGNGKTCKQPGVACPTVPGDATGTGTCQLPETTKCPPNTGGANCPM